jgi:hypothetical protein
MGGLGRLILMDKMGKRKWGLVNYVAPPLRSQLIGPNCWAFPARGTARSR